MGILKIIQIDKKMKTFSLTALFAISSVSAYAESEGPTKVDFGEADNNVVPREYDVANGAKFHGWTNPLSWTDGGDDDESVLINLQNHHRDHTHWENVSEYDAE